MSEIPRKRWLTLTEASRVLGVHRATLRVWADEGHIKTFRTPGGHRRFLASEIEAMIAAGGTPVVRGEDESLSRDLVTVARRDLSTLDGPGRAWLLAFPEEEREDWRVSGRRLIGLAIQYVSRRGQREAILDEVRTIGTRYGERCAARHVPLATTVRALLFFRESLLRATRPGLVIRGQYDEEEARIHREMRELLDEILYATLNAFQRTALPEGRA